MAPVPFTTCCCSSSNKERGAPPLAGPGGRAGPRRPAQPDAFVYYGSTRRAGRRPGLRAARAPGAAAQPALVGPGRVDAPGRVSTARASDRDTPPR